MGFLAPLYAFPFVKDQTPKSKGKGIEGTLSRSQNTECAPLRSVPKLDIHHFLPVRTSWIMPSNGPGKHQLDVPNLPGSAFPYKHNHAVEVPGAFP